MLRYLTASFCLLVYLTENVALGGQPSPVRLPQHLGSYNIRLLPFIEEGNFTTDGYIEIVFNCIAPTDNLTLNSAEIMFKDSLIKVMR